MDEQRPHHGINSPQTLWDAFQKTGNVNAYLAYRSALLRERGERMD